jgi:group I intron endonuclease
MFIYAVTNDVNDKAYVGACIRPLNRRWTNHLADARHGRGGALHAAMRECGVEKFHVSAIWSGHIPVADLKKLERYYIRCFQTLEPNGYNQTEGGDSVSAKAFLCLDRTGATPWNKDKPGCFAKTTIHKMAMAKIGRVVPVETRIKMALSQQLRRERERLNG